MPAESTLFFSHAPVMQYTFMPMVSQYSSVKQLVTGATETNTFIIIITSIWHRKQERGRWFGEKKNMEVNNSIQVQIVQEVNFKNVL